MVFGTSMDKLTSGEEAIVVFAYDVVYVAVDAREFGIVVWDCDNGDGNPNRSWLEEVIGNVIGIWDSVEDLASLVWTTDDSLEMTWFVRVELGDCSWKVVVVTTFTPEVVALTWHIPVTGTFDDFA